MASTTPDPLIWHYTGFEGLHGILKDKAMWASSLAYLNDAQEFKHTIAVAGPLITTAFSGHPLFSAEPALDFVRRVMTSVSKIYVSSFSTKRDDLSQWRAYGRD